MWPPSEKAWSRIPSHICGGIERYVTEGVKPGDFLTAVICNDLREAFMRADQTNIYNMEHIVRFFYNSVPAEAWSSPEVMRHWMDTGGLEGRKVKVQFEDSTDVLECSVRKTD